MDSAHHGLIARRRVLLFEYIYINIDLLEDKERRCTEQQRQDLYVYK